MIKCFDGTIVNTLEKDLVIAPLLLHGEQRLGLQHRPNQGVHLAHVAAEPEQPAGGPSDHQDDLHGNSVRLGWSQLSYDNLPG